MCANHKSIQKNICTFMCLRDLNYFKNLPEFVDWEKKHAAVDNSTKSSFQKKALNKSAKLPLSICLKSAQPNS